MSRSRFLFVLLLLVLLGLMAQPAWSMPNFARKYSMSCTGCHTVIPRLNETGFQFRKAGFRMPSEIGQDQKMTLDDAFTARLQARYDSKRSKVPGVSTKTTHQLTFHEVTAYPLSGSFGKHYGSLTELSILGEEFVEIENAYFRYTFGKEKAFFTARAGVFHPFEGYGASDRPYSLSRPFLQTKTANNGGLTSTFFTPWNFDQAGLELAYVYDKTSISGTLFNGLFVKGEGGSFKAFQAAGGELQKQDGFTKKNAKDVQVFLNQILKEDGSGVSAFFYRGSMDLPTDTNFTPANSFPNNFYRLAGYGSWMVVPKLGVQAGYQLGQDHFMAAADSTFRSQGFFGEADALVDENLTLGGRFDWFDPSKKIDQNALWGVTGFANVPLNDGLQCIVEYQHVQTQRGFTNAQKTTKKDDKMDDNLQVRLIWIW